MKFPKIFAFLRGWGFVFVFFTLSAMITERALKKVSDEHTHLLAKLTSLNMEKEEALALKEKLTQEINSQSDPSWIELVLKRELGLTPEGQIKVLFTN